MERGKASLVRALDTRSHPLSTKITDLSSFSQCRARKGEGENQRVSNDFD